MPRRSVRAQPRGNSRTRRFGLRHLTAVALVAVASLACAVDRAANAQPYPSRPIKVIVPSAAGGPLDLVARSLGDKLSASLKRPIIIENRVGAGGNIGTEAAAKAAPDCHTLLLVLSGTLVANPAIFKKLPFKPGNRFRADHIDGEHQPDAGSASHRAGRHRCRVRRLR